MKRILIPMIAAMLLPTALVAGPLGLQLGGLPGVDLPKLDLPDLPVDKVGEVVRSVGDLAQSRIDRLDSFVRSNRKAVEFDSDRQPAVKGVLVATGVDADGIAKARDAGFALSWQEQIDGLDFAYARFTLPKGMSLKEAEAELKALLPEAQVDADNIYFTSGTQASQALPAAMLASATVSGASLGLIDGGVADHPSVAGRVEQKGFVTGAPRPSSHGTSVAALMIGSGSVSGGAPGGKLLAADVYGNDKAGGNASAIARALGWLVSRNISVVTISLVGPDNGLLRKAIRTAQGKGVIIVAAVGNDGPAAPMSYPASYYGVLAITGVDARNRVLAEAGRASYIAFAAPAAGMTSATDAKSVGKVRGTSFAAPLVAGRLSLFYARPSVAAVQPGVRKLIDEAVDLGKPGSDAVFGDGLVCGGCVVRK